MNTINCKSSPQRLLPLFLSASTLLFTLLPAEAIIDTTLQMQLGNPSNATADTNNHDHYLIQRPVEALDYSDHLGQPNWASWDLTSGDVGSSGRSPDFYTDTSLPTSFFRVPGDPINPFSGSGYDRGHMCPSDDRTTNSTDNDMVFLMSNIIPQASAQNEGIWANFESQCRTLADAGNEVLITCGPSSFTTNKLYSNHVTIPAWTWKIAVVVPLGDGAATNRITPSTQVIALRIPNDSAVGSDPWQNYRTNVVAIEGDTGFTFFTALPPNLATVLRNKTDGLTAPAPAITGFSPTSGTVGSSVVITGTNLVFATNVTFNDSSAAFTIDSTAQITATVPAGAASGHIGIATLGGTTTSFGSFTVGTNTAPDLAITATHTGTFTQGDSGDTYTIIVTNIGNGPSSGAITVVDTLPTGLTATALTGGGWSTDLGTLTCVRSDALAAGAAYPPITVTVNVATNAGANVTNTATVSGGGDTTPANNTANDPTSINAVAAPTAITGTATGLGTTTATLEGTVNPNGQTTTAHFDYGLTTNYGAIASVAGDLTGSTPQAVTASLAGLVAATTYHFRVAATNALGSANGLDQTFTTAAAGVPDLAIMAAHTGNFTQGGTGDTYTVTVTNVGTVASSGTVTVTNALPAGLTATAISGSGWASDLGALTCTRSDALAAGTQYSAITITVNVASNAPASVTFTATVSGGGDGNPANNSSSDVTSINTSLGTATNVVISQLYGGGGNSGATYLNDFVELFNPLSTPVDLSTWSLQYASAAGSSWSANVVNLRGSIQPHHYYLVQLASNSPVGVALPTADVTNTAINMSATTGGKVALVSSQTALTGVNPVSSNGVVDFVGYGSAGAYEGSGAAPVPSENTSSVLRKDGGYTDSHDNAADFILSTPPTPRNSASPANPADVADLAVSTTHTGNFTQGDLGDTYTIIVTNLGNAPSSGGVTVADTLPIGLTATAISGTGWTTNLETLTCTRADALAAGEAYPPITVTVAVAADAAASITNVVAVSGGGDASPDNNTASDPTTILAAAAPTVTTGTATELGTTTATLNGTVNPNGQPATAQFQYGLTPDYGSNATIVGSLLGTTTQPVSTNLPGLLPGTTYHFRVVATNVLGANAGPDQVFTTLTPIEAWRLQWFGTTTDAGPAADIAVATSDGMPNLLKYALGLNPLVATNDPVAGDITTGYLRLTVPKNPDATDVSFLVEASDVVTSPAWTNSTTIDINTPTLLQVHADAPVASSAGGYIRLRVTRP